MKLLSIETSCDDTCISILEVKGGVTNANFKVLANSSNSQIPVHIPYGGLRYWQKTCKKLPIVLGSWHRHTVSPLLVKEGFKVLML